MNKNILMCVLLLCNYAYCQDSVFVSQAFLISDNSKIIYKNKDLKLVSNRIHNEPSSDRYYLIKILSKYKNSIYIESRYTIDANYNSSIIITGWTTLDHLGIYYNSSGLLKPYGYIFYNRGSKKKYFDAKLLQLPFEIYDIKNIDEDMWLKIKTEDNKYLWIPPELQCTDIWNACLGN